MSRPVDRHYAFGVAVVIRDPDELGGFPAGARINSVYPTLRLGMFTPGTVLFMHGERLRVLGAVGSQQALVEERQ